MTQKYKNLISTSRPYRAEIDALGAEIERMHQKVTGFKPGATKEDIAMMKLKMDQEQIERENQMIEEEKRMEVEKFNSEFTNQ